MNQQQDELIRGLNMIADAIEHGALLPPGMVDTVRRGASEIGELYHALKFERETNNTVMNQNAKLMLDVEFQHGQIERQARLIAILESRK